MLLEKRDRLPVAALAMSAPWRNTRGEPTRGAHLDQARESTTGLNDLHRRNPALCVRGGDKKQEKRGRDQGSDVRWFHSGPNMNRAVMDCPLQRGAAAGLIQNIRGIADQADLTWRVPDDRPRSGGVVASDEEQRQEAKNATNAEPLISASLPMPQARLRRARRARCCL